MHFAFLCSRPAQARRPSIRALALLVLCACGGGASRPSGPPVPSEPLELEVQQGDASGTMVITPWPGVVGDNELAITLLNGAGEPLEGATVKVSPWMPAHGHGSLDVTADEGEPGIYQTDQLVFNMPGLWEIRIRVMTDEGPRRLVGTIEVP